MNHLGLEISLTISVTIFALLLHEMLRGGEEKGRGLKSEREREINGEGKVERKEGCSQGGGGVSHPT